MQRQQPRREGAKPQLVPISMYPDTLALLDELGRAAGESRARVVRRLVELEIARMRPGGIERAPVWIMPSYRAIGPRMRARIVYRAWDGLERVFEVDAERILPEPPIGRYVLIGEGAEQLRGQVADSQVTANDGESILTITVRGLAPPSADQVHSLLLEYVHRLDHDIRRHSNAPISFDPYRTTPSWKLGGAEIRALLVAPPGEPARKVRFFSFAGPSLQDHLHPTSHYLPLVDVDDGDARERAAKSIAAFLEKNSASTSHPDPSDPYRQFVEAIYVLIHAELGGDPSQGGGVRRFGNADFGYAMDYKPRGDEGLMQFVVTITSGIHRGRRWASRYPWRTTAATTVAYDAIRAYQRLLED
jgi:hypothetical protein